MKYRITLLLSVLFLNFGLLATPFQNVLDTALATNTTIYLSKTGQATIVVNPAQYNSATDSVYISQDNFTCADINQNTSVLVQIYDTTSVTPLLWLNKSTIINPLDTSAPDISLVTAHTLYLNQAGEALLTFAAIDLGSWDSCGLNINGFKVLTKTNFYCSDIGTSSIIVSVPDYHGNLSTATLQVTILDTLPPAISLKPYTLFLAGLGSTATLQFANINDGTVDNCALGAVLMNGASQLNFGCLDTGFNKVVVIANDSYGNTSTDSINVYVSDTLNPSYTKTPFTAYLNADTAVVSRSNILSNVTGGCYAPVVELTSDSVFTCAAALSNPSYIHFSIKNGAKKIFDSVAVTVLDTLPPYLLLKTDTLILVNGNANVFATSVVDSTFDNCALDSITLNGVTTLNYTCADTGNQNIVVVLYDVHGNFTTKSVSVFVADTVSPNYSKTPFVASLISDSVAVSRANILSNITGGCFAPEITFTSDTVFTCADLFLNPHYVSFQLVAGTTTILDSVLVTVIDTTAPTLALKQDTLILIGGSASLSFTTINNNSSDNCGLDSATVNGATSVSYSCADTGSQKVIVVLYDVNGNTSTDSVNVFVADTVMPSYSKTPYTAYLLGDSVVVSRANILSNIAGGCFTPQVTLTSDSVFYCADILNNLNYITFTIGSGNQVLTDSVAITVADTIVPTLLLKTDTVYLASTSASLTFANINNGSVDNCGLDSATVNGATSVSYSCADPGSQKVIVVLYDVNGNASTDSVDVFVVDTISPSLVLKSDTLILVNGSADLYFANINNNSTDNCGLDSATVNGATSVSFSCADTGSQKVIVVLYDVNGNASTDSVDVFVADTVVPSYIKTPYTAYLLSDSVAVSRANIISGLTGGCFAPTLAFTSDTVFSCSAILSNPNYISFTVNSGSQTILDSVAVTVLDTAKPTLLLKTDTLILVNNAATLSFAAINNGSADNCSLDSATVNGLSVLNYTCLDTGLHQVVVVLYDASGNLSVDSVIVFVADTIGPSYTKTPFVANLIGDSASVSRANVLSNVVAGCFAPIVTMLSDTVFDCADIANNPIYVSFKLEAGNTTVIDSVAITVADITPPMLLLKSDTLLLQNGQASVSFLNVDAGSTDNCTLDSATINGMAAQTFTCSTAGKNRVVVHLYDVYGNVTTDSVDVYIQDSVTPTYLKTPYTANLVGDSVSVSRADILSNINGGCSMPFVTLISDTTFNCAAVLNNPNYVTFQISNGFAIQIDSVAVTVVDNMAPSFSLKPPPVLALNASGTRVLAYTDFLTGFPSDNCGVDSIYIVPPMLTCANTQGYTPVIVSVFDLSGNFTTQSTFALATDGTAPTLVTKLDTAYLGNTGQVTITPANVLDTAYDACGITSLTLNKYNYNCSNIGLNTVNVSAVDLKGNVKNKTTALYILDTLAPSFALYPSTNIYLNNLGTASVNFSNLVDGLVTDNCGITDTNISKTVFSCADVGLNPVFVSFEDASGNIRTKTGSVIVHDTLPPLVTVQNINRFIDTLTGMATISVWDMLAFANDNCGIDSSASYVSPNVFGCNNIGNNQVVISVYDVNNNLYTTTAIVTIDSSVVGRNKVEGEMQVCGNAFNVKYAVKDFNTNSQYNWRLNTTKGKIVSKSYKGREIYVHWFAVTDTSFLEVRELNLNSCGIVASDTVVNIGGLAPDTASIAYWSAITKTTLVSTDKVSNYFQWGFDEVVNGQLVSNALVGETANSYYNLDIASNISNLGYRYWCEASIDGQCWNRSYFNNSYPIGIVELSLGEAKVWPNPFADELNISSSSKIKTIVITDLFGKKVLEKHFENDTEIVLNGMDQLPAASYVLGITYADGSIGNYKIVRTK